MTSAETQPLILLPVAQGQLKPLTSKEEQPNAAKEQVDKDDEPCSKVIAYAAKADVYHWGSGMPVDTESLRFWRSDSI
jgi:hypothetical protein